MARQTHVNMMMGNLLHLFHSCCTMFYSEPCLQDIFRISHKPVIKYIKKITSLDGGRWALVSLDGVASSRMIGVSSSVNLPLHHKV